ncbi:uncharacterized protein LOC129952654 [Eupeodes corollae]|uniref:uncharacterized protein LOC129952654 n=1 Tax=Eupeodes corollae TaxID=290404 RepID=UPI0024936918|nr:uncharacterized protein LOC129952654 [Eupeodes corollae]
MDARDGSPSHILGLPIRSHTRIYVSYLIPSCAELFVYIVQFCADCAVSFQHFRYGQAFYGWITLMLILAPPVLCFIFVMTSAEQWSNPRHKNKIKFIGFQILSLLLFPIAAAYRFSRRIFWSIEALFHDNDDIERMHCLTKAGECSTCELYHLIQAYAQSAPQIILQLYHMLSQDLFRNYNTTTVQAISLIFAAIDLAAITVTYQRFESQKLAGRPYPWAVPKQIEIQKQRLLAAELLKKEQERQRRESERKISDFPESAKIMENFKLRHSGEENSSNTTTYKTFNKEKQNDSPLDIHVIGHDEVDNNGVNTELFDARSLGTPTNSTDDEKIQSNSPKLLKYFPSQATVVNVNAIEVINDIVPETPPPSLPPPELRTQTSTTSDSAARNRLSAMANRISTFRDMLWLNAQLYITENVPRPPKMLTTRLLEDKPPEDGRDVPPSFQPPSPPPPPSSSSLSNTQPHDETDFFIPRQYKIIKGIEQDDFAAKSVAFLGWLAFICMRMLALSTFCVFFTRAFLILIGAHYVLMLFWLSLESKFQDKLNRTLFYLLLAYVYVFVILEFRIKFRNIRVWYVGFFVVTMAENLVMTLSWWLFGEFESWWFGFMYDGIIYSGIIFSVTLIVYYCILRPREVIYLLPEDLKVEEGCREGPRENI